MLFSIRAAPAALRFARVLPSLSAGLLCLAFMAEQAPAAPAAPQMGGAEPAPIVPASASELDERFAEMGYRLVDVGAGVAEVPRLFLANLPPDLGALRSSEKRKRVFIKSLLPLVLRTNEAIWAQRERLLDLMRRRADGEALGWSERAWIRGLAEDYGADEGDLDDLSKRVDVIPPALALAQAAAESGWGTSRFAQKGNAVFGQRTWKPGAGLVPARRDQDKRHEVKTFEGLPDSVAAYMMNLNRHPAYARFRDRRWELRRGEGLLDGQLLVGTLIRYAEDGPDYVETLRVIIRVNRLHELDRARLQAPRAGSDEDRDAGV